ncbi:MAG: DNA polymerase III subunit gamma/tau [Granulosicoccus sp.]
MSYKVLARKWRPQHFRDMIGQEPVLRALINALDTGKLHHAYLFTGMRGVGKTTIARIFAKCLNCETNGVSADPCGECSSCIDIDAGRFFDLIEVDAASRTKVEETRELLENVPYAPASGRYKVYLIDEVHMFSTHSFNALLKTLEEPPEHVKFLLATTDPQKVPVTVLSRCLQFNLKRMPGRPLTDYLERILDAESVEYERPALELIARASEGSVRDSLSLVEQAAAFGEGTVRRREVEAMLGRVSTDRLLGLVELLARGDIASLFTEVDSLAEYAPDFSELLGELLTQLHHIALIQTLPDGLDESTPGLERLTAVAAEVAADKVQLFYQIGLHARRDMPFAPDPREAFDMALLRMHAFAPQDGAPIRVDAVALSTAEEPDRRTSSGAVTAADGTKAPPQLAVRGSVSAGAIQAVKVAPAAAARIVPTNSNGRAALKAAVKGDSGVADEADKRKAAIEGGNSANEEAVKRKAAETSVGRAQGSVGGLESTPDVKPGSPQKLEPEDWSATIVRLGLSGMPRQLASHCTLSKHEKNVVNLQLATESEHLNSPRFAARVQSALSEWLGVEIRLNIGTSSDILETPAKLQARSQADALDSARQAIDADPVVKKLIAGVDGAIDPGSVKAVTDSNN